MVLLVVARVVKGKLGGFLHCRVQWQKLNSWYLDDGSVAGNKERVQKVIDILLEHGPPRGLHLSTALTVAPPSKAKSTVWCPHATNNQPDPLERGIPRVEEEGIILLGCPIGSHGFVNQAIRI